jgi:hypothetical protein
MGYALLVAVVAGFAIVLGRTLFMRYRESDLRRNIRATDVAFSCVLSLVRTDIPDGMFGGGAVSAPMMLHVRGDSIEISSSWMIFRIAMGLEYLFKAHGVSIEYRHVSSVWSTRGWIIITGPKLGKEFQVAITRKDIFGGLYPIWNALIEAGAVAASQPPPKVNVPGCNSE